MLSSLSYIMARTSSSGGVVGVGGGVGVVALPRSADWFLTARIAPGLTDHVPSPAVGSRNITSAFRIKLRQMVSSFPKVRALESCLTQRVTRADPESRFGGSFVGQAQLYLQHKIWVVWLSQSIISSREHRIFRDSGSARGGNLPQRQASKMSLSADYLHDQCREFIFLGAGIRFPKVSRLKMLALCRLRVPNQRLKSFRRNVQLNRRC